MKKAAPAVQQSNFKSGKHADTKAKWQAKARFVKGDDKITANYSAIPRMKTIQGAKSQTEA